MEQLWEFITSHPWWSLIILGCTYLAIKASISAFRLYFHLRRIKTHVYLRITQPRKESQRDKDNEVEKDFREKIAIMAQFFRNMHEIRELNFYNMMYNRIFQRDKISFEMVCQNKIVDFIVVCPQEYRSLIEKQITSYYSDSDITAIEPYELNPEGNTLKFYYAFLANDFWYPTKTFKTVENDPLNSFTNVYSKLESHEKAGIQIIIRPKSQKWRKKAEEMGEAIFRDKKVGFLSKIPILGSLGAILTGIVVGADKAGAYNPNTGDGGGYVRMLQTKEEVAKQIGEKANQVGFDTTIRIFASAKTIEKAEELTNAIIVSFNLLKHAAANYYQTYRAIFNDWLNNKWMKFGYEKRLLYSKLFGFIGERVSILVPEELASLHHFPHTKYNASPTIRWLKYKILPAPGDVSTDEGIVLGHNTYRGDKKPICFVRKDRARHHYIIGKSGSGKSTILSYMARQDIKEGDGVCVIDPHGDLVDELITFVPKERAKDIIYFSPADVERPMGLNILEAKGAAQQDLAASQATEIFIKLFGDEIFGPRIQHYFRNACLTLMEDEEEGATLIDVPRIFVDEEFMKYKVAKVKNPVVRSFWEHEYANTGDREKQEMIPYFSSKFGPFITNSIMRNTIGQTKSAFNFRNAMDTQKILLVNLSKGKMGDLNTELLGLILVARVQMAAMSRADMPEEERKDFYLYVDEFQNFSTDSFCSILSEARKYKLALIMAHQYIGQLTVSKNGGTNTKIRDAVFGNCGSLTSFKIGAEDGEYMAKEFAPALSEQDLINIANYKAYIKLNIRGATSRPFSLDPIYDLSQSNKKVGGILKEYSRIKYGRKKEFVDQEISARIGIELDADENLDDKIEGEETSETAVAEQEASSSEKTETASLENTDDTPTELIEEEQMETEENSDSFEEEEGEVGVSEEALEEFDEELTEEQESIETIDESIPDEEYGEEEFYDEGEFPEAEEFEEDGGEAIPTDEDGPEEEKTEEA